MSSASAAIGGLVLCSVKLFSLIDRHVLLKFCARGVASVCQRGPERSSCGESMARWLACNNSTGSTRQHVINRRRWRISSHQTYCRGQVDVTQFAAITDAGCADSTKRWMPLVAYRFGGNGPCDLRQEVHHVEGRVDFDSSPRL